MGRLKPASRRRRPRAAWRSRSSQAVAGDAARSTGSRSAAPPAAARRARTGQPARSRSPARCSCCWRSSASCCSSPARTSRPCCWRARSSRRRETRPPPGARRRPLAARPSAADRRARARPRGRRARPRARLLDAKCHPGPAAAVVGDRATSVQPRVRLRVLALTVVVTIATTILSSLAPIRQALRADVDTRLEGRRTRDERPRPPRGGRWLVVVQVCLSVPLLIGAGLFLRTLSNLRSVPPRLPARAGGAVHDRSAARALCRRTRDVALFERLDEAIGAIPGVEAASLSEGRCCQAAARRRRRPDGRAPEAEGRGCGQHVGHRFFETMGIPILTGRSFDARDHGTSPPVAW